MQGFARRPKNGLLPQCACEQLFKGTAVTFNCASMR
uniref:Uncharacterized protein n=1 Tax=Sinorhizobium meliloti (strain SM11) TaxID=707241 RepID=Q1WLC5_SINMM|nr:hypothetical protein [Sinorhizobium meliloti]